MLAFQTIERRGDLIRTQAFQGQGEEEGCLLRMPGGGGVGKSGRGVWGTRCGMETVQVPGQKYEVIYVQLKRQTKIEIHSILLPKEETRQPTKQVKQQRRCAVGWGVQEEGSQRMTSNWGCKK